MTTAARWTVLIALFALPFIPLYVANGLYFPFITGKGFAFRVLVEIALAGYVLLAVVDQRYRPKFSWTLALFAGFVGWMAVANAFGVLPGKAFWSNFERMDGWVTLVHLLALVVVAGTVLAVDRLWRRWWLFFVGGAAIVCGYGLLQLGGMAEIHQGGARVDASFGNAIYLAVYLMFSILVAAWLAIESKGWLRYSLLAFCALATVILFYSASRGAVVGLAAGIAAGAGIWLWNSRKEGRGSLGFKAAAGALVALVLLVGGFYLARGSSFVQNEPALARLSSVFSLSQELQVRGTLWGIALQGAKDDPLTGWGQEGFNQVFNKYYDPSLYAQEAWFDRAHNTYLDWLVAGGVPALLLFLAVLGTALAVLLRAPGASRAERALLTAALVAYAVQALAAFDNLWSYVPFAMLLAMAHAASARPITRVEALPEPRDEQGRSVAAAAVLVLAAVVVWTVNVPNIQAAGHLVRALSPAPDPATNLALFRQALADGSFADQEAREQLVYFAGRAAGEARLPEAFRIEALEFAAEQVALEVQRSPNDARLRLQYAAVLEAGGDREGTLAQIDAALALSPRKQAILLQRGYALAALDRDEEAQEAFRTAYELDPSFDDLAIAAASGLLVAGDAAGARTLLLDSVGTTTPDSDMLLRAYYEARLMPEFVAVGYARVLAQDGSPESRLRYAEVLAAANRVPEARAELAALVAAYPAARGEAAALLARIEAALKAAGR